MCPPRQRLLAKPHLGSNQSLGYQDLTFMPNLAIDLSLWIERGRA
ncbi:hypothetical protein MPNT_80028 [Candidatus Methylacidithermus pantelleriae]|uniref:Uncharacterized protein n=1 Tax=Candidatus Methylacidithermus pantelleriae TaxID=2744239 RepID=A0A8J2BWI7_9BACT|nr:hypothetical protein MPNT_80028 [Candidatus Methylacidithermus pantelleriae]